MKPILSALMVISAAGCQQALVAKRAVDTVLAEGVNLYCKAPEPVRLANRARIAAKIAPHRIEIQCHGDG